MNHKLILGTAQIGLDYGVNNYIGKINKKEVDQILTHAFDSGISTLDTAEGYGDAHQILGNFHGNHGHCKFNINTKIQFSEKRFSICDRVFQYLEELQIEKIETLMFHSIEAFEKHQADFPALSELCERGVIKKFGVSVYDNWEFEKMINSSEIGVIQFPFNVLDNYSRRGELMVEAKRRGKILHSRSVYLQGLLFKPLLDAHPVVLALQAELKALHEIAASEKIKVPELAIRYCLQQEMIDKVIIGVDSLNQLKSNLSATTGNLSEEGIEQINLINVKDETLLNPSRW